MIHFLSLLSLYTFLSLSVTLSGASVQSQTEGSVLFEAVTSGNPDIITLLLDYGADPDMPNHSGHLPIHRAAYHGHLL